MLSDTVNLDEGCKGYIAMYRRVSRGAEPLISPSNKLFAPTLSLYVYLNSEII